MVPSGSHRPLRSERAPSRSLRWDDVRLDAEELEVTGQMDRTNTRGPVKRAPTLLVGSASTQATIDRLMVWAKDRETLAVGARSAWIEQGFVAVGSTGKPIGRESLAM